MLSIFHRVEMIYQQEKRIIVLHKSAHLAEFKTVAQEEPRADCDMQ